jgi:hypothetical protein
MYSTVLAPPSWSWAKLFVLELVVVDKRSEESYLKLHQVDPVNTDSMRPPAVLGTPPEFWI